MAQVSGRRNTGLGDSWLLTLFVLFCCRHTSVSGQIIRCTFDVADSTALVGMCAKKWRNTIETTIDFSSQENPLPIAPGIELFPRAEDGTLLAFIGIRNKKRVQLTDMHFDESLCGRMQEMSSPIILINSTATLSDSSFIQCFGPKHSRGLNVLNSTLTVRNCTFKGYGEESDSRRSAKTAGAVRAINSSVEIQASIFFSIYNAIDIENGLRLKIANSRFIRIFRQTGIRGLAVSVHLTRRISIRGTKFQKSRNDETSTVYVTGAETLSINGCVFRENAGKNGAGLCFEANQNLYQLPADDDKRTPMVSINGSSFVANIATRAGGAVYIDGANLRMTHSKVEYNTAYDNGAGVSIRRAETVEIEDCALEHQEFKTGDKVFCKPYGAGLYVEDTDKLILRQSRLSNNGQKVNGTSGGGAFLENTIEVEIVETEISGNIAEFFSGIQVKSVKSMSMVDSIVANHSARRGAGVHVVQVQNFAARNMEVFGNYADSESGISIQASVNCLIENSVFRNNSSINKASGLQLEFSLNASIVESVFADNKVELDGAALDATSIDLFRIIRSQFRRNVGGQIGAAVGLHRSYVIHINSSVFDSNWSDRNAAGLYLDNPDRVTITDSKFSNNIALKGGGAIYGSSISRINVDRTHFTHNNCSSESGGAISFGEIDNFFLTRCKFRRNFAYINGGAISLSKVFNNLAIRSTSFMLNEATGRPESQGGALSILVFSKLRISDSNFIDNTARGKGGALSLPKTKRELTRSFDVTQTTFRNNTARKGSGGAIFFEVTTPPSTLSDAGADSVWCVEITSVVIGSMLSIKNSVFNENSLNAENLPSGYTWALHESVYGEMGSRPSTEMRWDNPKLEALPPAARKPSPFEKLNGGALQLLALDSILIADSEISDNSAPGFGGGLFVEEAVGVEVTRSLFRSNNAYSSGGAIFLNAISKRLKIDQSTFSNNHVQGNKKAGSVLQKGGGLSVNGSRNIWFDNIHFEQNSAALSGGAFILNEVNEMKMTGCQFQRNSAENGGAILVQNSIGGSFEASTFERNSGKSSKSQNSDREETTDSIASIETEAGGCGGAILVRESASFQFNSLEFISNEASGSGGALHCYQSMDIVLSGSSFFGNMAGENGGAVSLHSANLTLSADQFKENRAMNGGVLGVRNGIINGDGLRTTKNFADNHGGLLVCSDPSLVNLTASKFVDDGSARNSAFKASCDCRVYIRTSKIVCSNSAADGCGKTEVGSDCPVENVIMEEAALIQYNKPWKIFMLVALVVFIPSVVVLISRCCTKCTTGTVDKLGRNSSKGEDLLNDDGLAERWSLLEDGVPLAMQRREEVYAAIPNSYDSDGRFGALWRKWRPTVMGFPLPPCSSGETTRELPVSSHFLDDIAIVDSPRPSTRQLFKSHDIFTLGFATGTMSPQSTVTPYTNPIQSRFTSDSCMDHTPTDVLRGRNTQSAIQRSLSQSARDEFAHQQDIKFDYEDMMQGDSD